MILNTIYFFIILVPQYSTTKYIIKTIDQCFYKALYYIGCSLNCLQYFKNDKDTMVSNIQLI